MKLKGSYPRGDTARKAYDALDLHRAIGAYRFFDPTVPGAAIFEGMKKIKVIPNQTFGWMDTQPRHVAYDAQTRSQVNTQGEAALRSLFELKDVAGKSVDLFFEPKPPKDREGRWIKTSPGRAWFVYFRIYGPEQPAFNGTWKPGDFTNLQ